MCSWGRHPTQKRLKFHAIGLRGFGLASRCKAALTTNRQSWSYLAFEQTMEDYYDYYAPHIYSFKKQRWNGCWNCALWWAGGGGVRVSCTTLRPAHVRYGGPIIYGLMFKSLRVGIWGCVQLNWDAPHDYYYQHYNNNRKKRKKIKKRKTTMFPYTMVLHLISCGWWNISNTISQMFHFASLFGAMSFLPLWLSRHG
jgi:hypothetical protein